MRRGDWCAARLAIATASGAGPGTGSGSVWKGDPWLGTRRGWLKSFKRMLEMRCPGELFCSALAPVVLAQKLVRSGFEPVALPCTWSICQGATIHTKLSDLIRPEHLCGPARKPPQPQAACQGPNTMEASLWIFRLGFSFWNSPSWLRACAVDFGFLERHYAEKGAMV